MHVRLRPPLLYKQVWAAQQRGAHCCRRLLQAERPHSNLCLPSPCWGVSAGRFILQISVRDLHPLALHLSAKWICQLTRPSACLRCLGCSCWALPPLLARSPPVQVRADPRSKSSVMPTAEGCSYW